MSTLNNTIIDAAIKQAFKEDVISNDVTTKLLTHANSRSKAHIVAKEDGIICGLDIAKRVFKQLDPNIKFETKKKDKKTCKKGETILIARGNTQALLTAERTALNFLGYLSGIATNTNKYVSRIKEGKARVYDTRKTTPGLRAFEKYAVLCGGGNNHRMNLSDMLLVKDNHRHLYDNHVTLAEEVELVKKRTKKPIGVEVDTIEEYEAVLDKGPTLILLDNMTPKQLKHCVKLKKASKNGRRTFLEASGGVTLRNIAAVARSGVDRIAIGALTHSYNWINYSMEFIH